MVTVYTLYDSEGKLVRRVGYQTSSPDRIASTPGAVLMIRQFLAEADKTHPKGMIKIEYFDDYGKLL